MAFNFNSIWGVFIVLGALFVIYYIRTLYRGKKKYEDQGDDHAYGFGQQYKGRRHSIGGKRKRKPRRKQRLR